MYLATIQGATPSYQIRQSYLDSIPGRFCHRLVFDLGINPADHMELMGEATVVFSSELAERVSHYTSDDVDNLLEKLLWDFLPHQAREQISRFDRSDCHVPPPLSQEDLVKIDSQIHIFDRRRLYYLHFGAINQSRLFGMSKKALRPLLDQSRDEREYFFAAKEKCLEPTDYRNYLYAIFNLQNYFTNSYAIHQPEALPPDEVADHFVDALCQLNSTLSFWQNEEMSTSLHHHLVRYLLMFFDFSPGNRTFADEYIRRFMNSHRTFRWPERTTALSKEHIKEIFGEPFEQLQRMNSKELNRLYRKRALDLHPDQGGDQERFMELTEVYTALRQKLPTNS